MFTAISALLGSIISGITSTIQGKQRIKQAVIENKVRLAASTQEYNAQWELKALESAGFKDDILFYAFIAMFMWAGFDPDAAKQFFTNLQVLPDWMLKTWMWVVASVIGVKKVGDYLPGTIKGVKDIFSRS